MAKRLLPESLIGLSVLAGEDYHRTGSTLDLKSYGYVEPNWKFTFRRTDRSPEEVLEEAGPAHTNVLI